MKPGKVGLTNDQSLRILHVSTEVGFRGGEQQVLNLMSGLDDRSVVQALISPAQTPLAARRPEAVTWHPLPPGRRNPLVDAVALRRAVLVFRPTIVHAHTSHGHGLVRTAQTLRLINLPLVVTRRVDFPLKPGLANRWKYLNPSVSYIAISQAVRRALVAGGIHPNRVRLVHSGIDPDRFGGFRTDVPQWDRAVLKPLGLHESDGPLWICVAALADHKDHPTLLRAVARLNQRGLKFQVALAGSGECRTSLEAQSVELGIGHRIRFLGRIETPELIALHRAATGFVLTSKLEGLGTAVLDAMAAGLPVVATAAGGIPESVKPGETGWLCPVGDDEKVADAMAEVQQGMANHVSVEYSELFRVLESARNHVLGGFTHHAMVEGTLQAYLDCQRRS